MINIVLCEPEIPYNTGNIARTCLLTGSKLHLIRPFPFKLDDKHIKKAGLDYWEDVEKVIHDSFDEFLAYAKGASIYYASSKAERLYTDVQYEDGSYIVFGPESRGLDKKILDMAGNNKIKIPMLKKSTRSYNLSNSAAIILFEALRQNSFNIQL